MACRKKTKYVAHVSTRFSVSRRSETSHNFKERPEGSGASRNYDFECLRPFVTIGYGTYLKAQSTAILQFFNFVFSSTFNKQPPTTHLCRFLVIQTTLYSQIHLPNSLSKPPFQLIHLAQHCRNHERHGEQLIGS